MRADVLGDLRCPICLAGLRVDDTYLPPSRARAAFGEELAEGLLLCSGCAAHFPVLAGVALLVANPVAYVASIAPVVAGLVAPYLSPAMLAYWRARGVDLGGAPGIAVGYVSTANLGRYIFDHYENLAELMPEGHPLRHLADGHAGDWQGRLLQLAEPHLASRSRAVDVGCNVGGTALRLSWSFAFVWGLDYSFPAVLWARRILLAQPEPLTNYQLRADGEIFDERALDFERPSNVEFVVASADAMPFAPESQDLAVLANLIDVVPHPAKLLDGCRALLRPGGVLAMTDPYYWDPGVAAGSDWLGGRPGEPSADGTRRAVSERFLVCAERDLVPWVLRNSDRYYQVYFCHHLVARKEA